VSRHRKAAASAADQAARPLRADADSSSSTKSMKKNSDRKATATKASPSATMSR
jgi:hypothetical protein